MTTYYVTKYALSGRGEPAVYQESDVARVQDNGRIWFRDNWTVFTIGKDVFTDESEARAAILAARDRKIASLEKQIAKLRKIGGAA